MTDIAAAVPRQGAPSADELIADASPMFGAMVREQGRSSEDQLATVLQAIRDFGVDLGVEEKPHKTHGRQFRFTCPSCGKTAAAVAYANRSKVVVYCNVKSCDRPAITAALGLDWEAITGQPDPVETAPADLPRIDVTNEVDAIERVVAAIRDGVIPDLYQRDGVLVTAGESAPEPGETRTAVTVAELGEHDLRARLVRHTVTYRVSGEGDRSRALPSPAACRTILAFNPWPGVDPLRGVVRTPVLRPDGTILQESGYDPVTRLYLAGGGITVRPIPDRPTAEDVAAAKHLILGRILVDFPWVDDADRANYLALLLTPVLRPYVRRVSPLAVISAPERGSGKSLLAEILKYTFGCDIRPWPANDDEMRKGITGALRDTKPMICYDNVPAGGIVDHPSFAGLLTSEEWTDRVLGQSANITLPNDRQWLVNGTNVRLGGDMGQRSTLIRIDPKMPNPDQRTGFVIPDLPGWVQDHRNRGDLIRALLVLARDWVLAGAPATDIPMRGYTRWATILGGVLAHHGVAGFLGNRREIETFDEDAETWGAFLAAWSRRYGTTPQKIRDILPADAFDPMIGHDPMSREWLDVFPRVRGGLVPSDKALAKMLRERRDRFYGTHAVRVRRDGHSKIDLWYVVEYQPGGSTPP